VAGKGWRLSQRGRSCAHPAPVAACFCKKGCGRVTGPPQALALVLSPAKVLFLSALHCVLCDCELCNCALSDSALCYCVLLCNCAPCYSAPCYCATAYCVLCDCVLCNCACFTFLGNSGALGGFGLHCYLDFLLRVTGGCRGLRWGWRGWW
jgi:hypothetical protein